MTTQNNNEHLSGESNSRENFENKKNYNTPEITTNENWFKKINIEADPSPEQIEKLKEAFKDMYKGFSHTIIFSDYDEPTEQMRDMFKDLTEADVIKKWMTDDTFTTEQMEFYKEQLKERK